MLLLLLYPCVPLLLPWPLSHTCHRLAHELRFYNLNAPQLDKRLRPAEPDYRLVLVGGECSGSGPSLSAWLQCFDDKACGWGRLEDMSVERPNTCGAAAVGSCLFAWGGEGLSVETPGFMSMYDLASRKVAELARPPRPLAFTTGVACCGLVYCLGGLDMAEGVQVADMCTYNPELDTWVPGLPLPFAVEGIAAAEYAGSIYACGGTMLDGVTRSHALLLMDPRTRAWAALPSMLTPTAYTGAAMVEGRLYVPGGRSSDPSILQCYDVAAGRWDTNCPPMVEARASPGVGALRGEVWAVGGEYDRSGFDDYVGLASVEVYSPRLNTWREAVSLPYPCFDCTCVVVQC